MFLFGGAGPLSPCWMWCYNAKTSVCGVTTVMIPSASKQAWSARSGWVREGEGVVSGGKVVNGRGWGWVGSSDEERGQHSSEGRAVSVKGGELWLLVHFKSVSMKLMQKNIRFWDCLSGFWLRLKEFKCCYSKYEANGSCSFVYLSVMTGNSFSVSIQRQHGRHTSTSKVKPCLFYLHETPGRDFAKK